MTVVLRWACAKIPIELSERCFVIAMSKPENTSAQQADTLFSEQKTDEVVDFVFDAAVVDVFPDMINRSVPGYATIIKMTGMLAEKFVQPNTRCYDLGCSLGASTFAMRHHIQADGVEIVAMDNSQAMLNTLRPILETDTQQHPNHPRVELALNDIEQCEIHNASMVVLNFTLQFVPMAQRAAIIQKIYDGLIDGGVLVLSEKLRFDNDDVNDLFIDLHHTFKRSQGYSELEVANKRAALENVLWPETQAEHVQRCTQAGFTSCDVWFQCLNFASMVAIK